MIIWHLIVYCPLAHATWHPLGVLRVNMVMDFAGGTVVHMASGYAALMGSLYLGPSRVKAARQEVGGHVPANVPHVLLGTALLWFGW